MTALTDDERTFINVLDETYKAIQSIKAHVQRKDRQQRKIDSTDIAMIRDIHQSLMNISSGLALKHFNQWSKQPDSKKNVLDEEVKKEMDEDTANFPKVRTKSIVSFLSDKFVTDPAKRSFGSVTKIEDIDTILNHNDSSFEAKLFGVTPLQCYTMLRLEIGHVMSQVAYMPQFQVYVSMKPTKEKEMPDIEIIKRGAIEIFSMLFSDDLKDILENMMEEEKRVKKNKKGKSDDSKEAESTSYDDFKFDKLYDMVYDIILVIFGKEIHDLLKNNENNQTTVGRVKLHIARLGNGYVYQGYIASCISYAFLMVFIKKLQENSRFYSSHLDMLRNNDNNNNNENSINMFYFNNEFENDKKMKLYENEIMKSLFDRVCQRGILKIVSNDYIFDYHKYSNSILFDDQGSVYVNESDDESLLAKIQQWSKLLSLFHVSRKFKHNYLFNKLEILPIRNDASFKTKGTLMHTAAIGQCTKTVAFLKDFLQFDAMYNVAGIGSVYDVGTSQVVDMLRKSKGKRKISSNETEGAHALMRKSIEEDSEVLLNLHYNGYDVSNFYQKLLFYNDNGNKDSKDSKDSQDSKVDSKYFIKHRLKFKEKNNSKEHQSQFENGIGLRSKVTIDMARDGVPINDSEVKIILFYYLQMDMKKEACLFVMEAVNSILSLALSQQHFIKESYEHFFKDSTIPVINLEYLIPQFKQMVKDNQNDGNMVGISNALSQIDNIHKNGMYFSFYHLLYYIASTKVGSIENAIKNGTNEQIKQFGQTRFDKLKQFGNDHVSRGNNRNNMSSVRQDDIVTDIVEQIVFMGNKSTINKNELTSNEAIKPNAPPMERESSWNYLKMMKYQGTEFDPNYYLDSIAISRLLLKAYDLNPHFQQQNESILQKMIETDNSLQGKISYHKAPVKGEKRAKEKCDTKYQDKPSPPLCILDFVRGTYQVNDIDTLYRVYGLYVDTIDSGNGGCIIRIAKIKNTMKNLPNGIYGDIKLILQVENPFDRTKMFCELQFLLKYVMEAKKPSHKIYEITRKEDFYNKANRLLSSNCALNDSVNAVLGIIDSDNGSLFSRDLWHLTEKKFSMTILGETMIQMFTYHQRWKLYQLYFESFKFFDTCIGWQNVNVSIQVGNHLKNVTLSAKDYLFSFANESFGMDALFGVPYDLIKPGSVPYTIVSQLLQFECLNEHATMYPLPAIVENNSMAAIGEMFKLLAQCANKNKVVINAMYYDASKIDFKDENKEDYPKHSLLYYLIDQHDPDYHIVDLLIKAFPKLAIDESTLQLCINQHGKENKLTQLLQQNKK